MSLTDEAIVCGSQGMQQFLGALAEDDYEVHGPVVRDDAIVIRPISSIDELPLGWTQSSEPGEVRLVRRDDRLRFGWAVSGQPWKTLLHPARVRTMSMTHVAVDEPVGVSVAIPERRRTALFGVRPCDLAAIERLDTVLVQRPPSPDPIYAANRNDTVVVVVNCNTPASTCFCSSMDTGPHVGGRTSSHDVEVTELAADGPTAEPTYVIAPVSEIGADIVARLTNGGSGNRRATTHDVAQIASAEADARRHIERRLDDRAAATALARSHDSTHWADIADRCLACGNCTAVCPTCFCTRIDDVGDLSGHHVDRWRTWESCFSLEFSRVGSTPVRSSLASRYRQWMTHKLSSWHEQFGESGCTGCGRCIAWCPVGIDLMHEADSISRAAVAGRETSPAGAGNGEPQ